MITITENGILIEILGAYGAEDVERLHSELMDALQIASGAKDKGSNYYWLFVLLQSLSPTSNQIKELYPARPTFKQEELKS